MDESTKDRERRLRETYSLKNLKQLRELCRQRGLDTQHMRKTDVIEALIRRELEVLNQHASELHQDQRPRPWQFIIVSSRANNGSSVPKR